MKDKFINILVYIFAIMTFGASLIRLISGKTLYGFIPLSLSCFLLSMYLQDYKRNTKKTNFSILLIALLLILIGYVQIIFNL